MSDSNVRLVGGHIGLSFHCADSISLSDDGQYDFPEKKSRATKNKTELEHARSGN
jgi:hypothetical protein